MPSPSRALHFAAAALVVSGGLIVASCGGGSVNTSPVATVTSAPATQSIPTGGGALTLASSSSTVATLGFAAGVPAGVSLTASSSASAPAGAPAISSLTRAAASLRSAQTVTGAVPFFWVTFSVSANLSAQFLSSETVSLGTNPPTAQYGVAFDDITTSPASALGDAGPGTIASGIVTILNQTSADSPVLQAGHTYLMQFFYVPASTATATPTGAAPTATPTGAAPTATPTGQATGATPTPIPGYTFAGGPDTTNCASPSPCSVPIGITDGPLFFSALFQSPSVTTNISASVATASQITPSGFTFYTGTGTAEIYFQLSAAPEATFAMTPQIGLSGLTGVNGCAFWGYVTGGSSNAWTLIAPATGAAVVSNGNVTIQPIALGGGNTVDLKATPFFGAIVCN